MSGESMPERAGEWVVPDVSYVDPLRLFCALCGRPIARRYWRVTEGGSERAYCEVRHAELDRKKTGSRPELAGEPSRIHAGGGRQLGRR